MSNSNLKMKLFNIMKEVGRYEKDTQVNTRSGSYRGVSHDKVLSTVRSLLISNGVLVTSTVVDHQFQESSNMAIATVDVTFCDIDHPDEELTVRMFGFGLDTQDKGPGKAISYAVKYAFLKTFNMQTGDDPENDSIERDDLVKSKKRLQEVVRTSEQVASGSPTEDLQVRSKQLISRIGSWGKFVEKAREYGIDGIPDPAVNKGKFTNADYIVMIEAAEKILKMMEGHTDEDT